jgi:hypothetical protein
VPPVPPGELVALAGEPSVHPSSVLIVRPVRAKYKKEDGGCGPAGPAALLLVSREPRKDERARFHRRRNRNADDEGAAPRPPLARREFTTGGPSQAAGNTPASIQFPHHTIGNRMVKPFLGQTTAPDPRAALSPLFLSLMPD